MLKNVLDVIFRESLGQNEIFIFVSEGFLLWFPARVLASVLLSGLYVHTDPEVEDNYLKQI